MSEEMPNIEGGSPTPPEGIPKEAPKPFQPSWIMEKEDEYSSTNPRLQLRARQIHQSPESIVTGGFLRNHFRGIQGEVRRGEVPEDEADVLSAKIAAKIEELDSQKKAKPKAETVKPVPQIPQTTSIEKLAEAVVKFGEQIASGGTSSDRLLRQQAEQSSRLLEALRGGGYDSLVSTENAQAPISWESFEGQQLAWYRELNEEWQTIIRNRLTILTGCYIKRAQGHLNLDAVAQNERARIDTRALSLMWEKMPEFRIALATMMDKFFEIREEIPQGLDLKDKKSKVYLIVLKDEVLEKRGALVEFEKYKKELAESLAKYLGEHPEVSKIEEGSPMASPEVAARAGVAAAWNLLFLGNAIESGDQGDLRRREEIGEGAWQISKKETKEEGLNPTVGRRVKNSIVYAEQVRAMMLPFDKAWDKAAPTTVGTEETWLGDLGDYLAERNRHDETFRKEFALRQRRIVPQRLFASLFDMLQLEITKITKEGKKEISKISLGKALLMAEKTSLKVNPKEKVNPEEKVEDLKDFVDRTKIDFSSLKKDELWGAYADSWDSAKKIYELLGGKKPIEKLEGLRDWRQTLVNALQKMRKTTLSPYYRDPELIIGCIGGSAGLVDFTNEYLLARDDGEYDVLVTAILDDDRLVEGIKNGRQYILRKLHAKDLHSYSGYLSSLTHTERSRIRGKAASEARLLRAK